MRDEAAGGLPDVALPDSPATGPSGPSVATRGVMPGMHYHLVGEEVWAALHAWFGGGPVLRRIVGFAEDAATPSVRVHPEVDDGRVSAVTQHACT